ncbi:Ribosome-binding protein 1 [Babesia ovata]|uniref:Ribosome-binding protein 1 n=1 Tax=Babesia ovata TaxID=189622 RepID=A0A2H6KFV9_9APIC|nr:Ribosome-binding protein 1 [Babesia ovata]GBE61876.1 Ribosome-binding protein 1 [Babesia ovata]
MDDLLKRFEDKKEAIKLRKQQEEQEQEKMRQWSKNAIQGTPIDENQQSTQYPLVNIDPHSSPVGGVALMQDSPRQRSKIISLMQHGIDHAIHHAKAEQRLKQEEDELKKEIQQKEKDAEAKWQEEQKEAFLIGVQDDVSLTGTPFEDELLNRLQDQRELWFQQKDQKDLSEQMSKDISLAALMDREKKLIEKFQNDAEKKHYDTLNQRNQDALFDDLKMTVPTYTPPKLPDMDVIMGGRLKTDKSAVMQYIDPPMWPSLASGAPIPDPNLKPDLSPQPIAHIQPAQPPPTVALDVWKPYVLRDNPDTFTDLYIDVPKPIVQDPVYDLDFDDETTHIKHDALPLPPDPYIPEISFNLPPPDPQHSVPPRDEPTISAVEFVDTCPVPWLTQKPTHDSTNIPETELFPSEAPRTVRDMLIWMAGLQNPKHSDTLKQCIEKAFKRGDDVSAKLTLPVNDSSITAKDVIDTIKLAAVFAASVLSAVAPEWKDNVALSATLKPKGSDQSKDPDCCALLCQLRDCVYACYHQLNFLKSQCSRNTKDGGWQDCQYGRDAKMSPLQAFLTDASDSKFETHPFDPRNICRKSRVNMGFREEDLPDTQQTGKHLHTILSPTCGGEDPLLTLTSYLTCITRRTPRTTGELVSFFHHFGNELHNAPSKVSPLGSALSKPHDHCPDWDHLAADDLNAIQYIRGPAPPTANHDKGHSRTLSTLVGCDITNAQCPPHISSTTYRAYALYSSSFVHDYLSWTVYLPDRLWESLLKMQDDLEDLQCHDSKPLHQCDKALPLLYKHGITPPDGTLPPSLTCSKLITKLEEVVKGKPIAGLMTAMDNFLYRIRAPFLFCLVALWLIAALYILHSLLYRMDVLRIRYHLLTTRASHTIDVKALLAGSRRMLSLYKDVDYFDDDFHS